MSSERNIRNLALIGFMGSGKSSVGRLVSGPLHLRFIDTDEMIEARAGKVISQIFADAGEEAFRRLESQVVEELSRLDSCVISTGGGLAANEKHLASLKTHALVVCLWASAEVLWERVQHQQHRPLLQATDPKRRIQELLAEREPFYKQADVLVNTECRTLREVAQHVMHQFQLAAKPST